MQDQNFTKIEGQKNEECEEIIEDDLDNLTNTTGTCNRFRWAKWLNIILLVFLVALFVYMVVVNDETKGYDIALIILFHALIGGTVNFLVVHMIFNRIKFIPGSGSVERDARKIMNKVATMVLTDVLPYEKQEEIYVKYIAHTAEDPELRNNVEDFFRSNEFRSILHSTFEEMSNSFVSIILKKTNLNIEELEDKIVSICVKHSASSIPKVAAMMSSQPFYSSQMYNYEMASFITSTLDKIPPKEVSDIIFSVMEPQINLITLWGNIGGILTGTIMAFVINSRSFLLFGAE